MTQIQNNIRDNKNYGSVGDFLKDVIKEGSELSVVSAYFTIFAYYSLHKNLDTIKSMKFLFGEPTFCKTVNTDIRSYKIEDDELIISTEEKFSQKYIAKKCADWLKEKVEIKSIVKPNFLHGKMYYSHREIQDIKEDIAISGSSNFTTSGLGLKKESNNIELNLVVDSDRQKQELKEWFDTIWNDNTGLVQDVKEEVLKYLEQLYKENEPEFVYFKTLYNIFADYLEEQQNNDLFDEKAFKDTVVWNKLYEFQKDGVKGAINKLQKNNGCIIADSVGLGKTFEALAIIKYYELKNYRVLVLCPKKLSDNWTIYQASKNNELNVLKEDRFQYHVLYHTDMGRNEGKSGADGHNFSNFNWAAYDLVVIDESHNFKGNPLEKEKNGEVRFNRAKWLMEKIIKSGCKTKVLMLSATPVNNSLKDLRNQINFITEGDQTALLKKTGVTDIAHTLELAQKQFTTWSDTKKNPDRSTKQLLEKLDSSFFKLLDELTIARSRKHIVKFYNDKDVEKFPKREKPISIYSKIDTEEMFPSYSDIDEQISKFKLSLFNPSKYLKDNEAKEKYAKMIGQSSDMFDQEQREDSLIGMMKVGYLKRLESSIHSFAISIKRTVDKIKDLEEKIEEYKKNPSHLNSTYEDSTSDDENFLEEIESNNENQDFTVGRKLKIELKDLKLEEWLNDLQKDKSSLISLFNNANAITVERDAKLKELKELIKQKVQNPFNEQNKKIIIFTAFSDTAEYIYDSICEWVLKELKLEIALVCGSVSKTTFGKNEFNAILTNFSPKSKSRDKIESFNKSKEIDILIATDCISEGQNLQDCDYLINYDIHWNPVRIIQRFGRIDRLGSKNKSIKLVNFWPTQDLDNYINLKTRVESRMALVDLTATAEDNILQNEEVKELISDDLKYRDKQLQKLKEEVLDLEDMGDSISLTDFTLDDFRVELSSFVKNNEDKLKNCPNGIYAIIPSPQNRDCNSSTISKQFDQSIIDFVKPGVIYCLKQKTDDDEKKKINALSPFYLVYVLDDGTVKLNFTSAKTILELYRELCVNEKEAYQKLCDMFNKETNNGIDMSHYSTLIESAINKISSSVNTRGAINLTNSRNAIIQNSRNVSRVNDFELITWLIIK